MRVAHFCIERPIFATVSSILIVLIGIAAYFTLPVAQYPEIAPPTVVVRAQYPGASADVLSATVATPIEQEINGVENMLYMSSQATGDGQLAITVSFALGTNLDQAQVQVQNRVAVAEPRLPEDVRRLGVTVRKSSPDLLMVIQLYSPDGSRSPLYISNYATLQIRDALLRINGVGDVRLPTARDYAMVAWLDPDKVAARNLTASEVIAALRAQNVQVAAGVLNEPPVPNAGAFQLNVETLGRLSDPSQFENIIVKTDAGGRVTRVRDVARVELTAQSFRGSAYLDGLPAQPIQIYQQPGSNALETANRVIAAMQTMGRNLPAGVEYSIPFNPTEFIAESVHEVYKSIFEAVGLVVLVVVLFLQTWRAAVIPILAIPISLIGTFAVMAALGYSLNNLSLLGLVLAIGIVVDDAIVVVENVERHLRAGLSAKEAAHRSMDEIGGALIAIALVLCAVFIPAAMISGISGQFFRQFAVTIAAATAISAFVSLTLSPALCAILLKPHDHEEVVHRRNILARGRDGFFRAFNAAFDRISMGYGHLTKRFLRVSALMLVAYVGLLGLTGWQLALAPRGFIPVMDQGYFINAVQLPPGSSLARTDEVMKKVSDRLMATEGIAHVVAIAGLDGATFTSSTNTGLIFAVLTPYEARSKRGLDADRIIASLPARMRDVAEARVIPIKPPSVRGIGNSGGFKMMIEDRRGGTASEIEAVSQRVSAAANQAAELAGVFSPFNTATPKLYADIDRVKAEMLGVPASRVFETLEVYLGSAYVNDFNFLGRTFQVRAQADGQFRQELSAVENFKTRSDSGAMVPLSSVATFEERTGPYRVPRYNLYPAAEVQGAAAAGFSTGQALDRMEKIAAETLPEGYSFEWTELALQERLAGNTGLLVFAASVVFVFLLLAAQYESWTLPLSVILIVPMCLLAALAGLRIFAMEMNILAQIGLVVLIGLAAKNAILIVEFARQAEHDGMSRAAAAIQAARVRLRPILMTSFAFILGVVPLVIATGAGAEMRQSLGTAVFFGMLGVTAFGLVFTPIFYVVCRAMERRTTASKPHEVGHQTGAA
ncbi:multidrug efflux RND transporter permease subunit [Bradyrhizobium sp. LHD-71]|uniref:efflux RND transporter permease subunit n=1 Tax=Bradyrhizobium sp. LHD-71 TaxID=3072141 RepID=UPI00280E11F6|nr:multidrug efflux RND transporter permease subunit [Bradyrhizobium sp. LHD-71]MDQ8729294.1 multidrug efflux RND transporter permease subunit [Bradyrhizobium sp. LHD-71]